MERKIKHLYLGGFYDDLEGTVKECNFFNRLAICRPPVPPPQRKSC